VRAPSQLFVVFDKKLGRSLGMRLDENMERIGEYSQEYDLQA